VTPIRTSRFFRSLVGLVLGSLAAAFVYLLIEKLMGFGEGLDEPVSVLSALPGSLLVLVFSLPCGFVAHASLYALKWRAVWLYGIAGAISATLYVATTNFDNFAEIGWDNLASTVPAATICAVIAWLIRRPDRDNVAVPKAIKTA